MNQPLKPLFEQADALVIHTGAGMGRDSGLADYRGEGGTWGKVSGETEADVLDIINPAYMSAHPEFAWRHYAERMKEFATHAPHRGFYLVKEWIERFQLDYFVVTSNIDSYFQRAGYSEDRIREVHGTMAYLQCSTPCCSLVRENKVDYAQILEHPHSVHFPQCPECNALLRPNIYMFRDNTFVKTRFQQQKQHFETFLQNNKGKKMIVLEIGSGPHVQTIRAKTRELATRHGATIIRINPKDYKVREGHISIAKGALDALQEMEKQLAESS